MTLPNLQSLLVTGDLESAVSLSVTGETTDEAAAKNLADVVRGFTALIALQAAQKPELKEPGLGHQRHRPRADRVLLSARFPYELLDALQGPGQRGVGRANARALTSLVACNSSFEGALRGCRSARSGLIARAGQGSAAISAFTEQSRRSRRPLRAPTIPPLQFS